MRKRTRKTLFTSGHRDENHGAIASFMSQFGPEPIDTSKVGGGYPDLTWPFQGQTVLVEVKMPGKPLTPAQARFHREWRGGPLFVVESELDVCEAIKTLTRPQIRAAVRG